MRVAQLGNTERRWCTIHRGVSSLVAETALDKQFSAEARRLFNIRISPQRQRPAALPPCVPE